MAVFSAHSQCLFSRSHEIIVAVMTQQLLTDAKATPGGHSGPWTVLASAVSSAARVELRRYELPRPNEMWELDEAPILSIVMPRVSAA